MLFMNFVDHVRDLESPVHLRPAIARSASKKRRQHHGDPGLTLQLKNNEEFDETDSKKVCFLWCIPVTVECATT